jgi:D-psicose/D-tagatose/L-ribulose 3-epimerase
MRFGLNTFLLVSPFTTADAGKVLKKVKEWGFDSAEIPIEDPSHIDPKAVKAALDKAGLVCGSACACMGPGRDFRGTPEEQKTAMEYCKALIDQMVELDCPNLVGPVYSVVGKADAVEPAQQKEEFALVVKNLKELCAYAQSKGRIISVEPLNRFETDFLNTVEQGLKLIKAVGSPALKLHLDTFHMNIEEKNQAEAIRRAGKLLGHFHACGTDRGTPGGDSLQWKPIIQALKEVGYDGDIVIESFTTDVKVIARAAAIWRKIEPNRNDIAIKGLENLQRFFGRKARSAKPAANGKTLAKP